MGECGVRTGVCPGSVSDHLCDRGKAALCHPQFSHPQIWNSSYLSCRAVARTGVMSVKSLAQCLAQSNAQKMIAILVIYETLSQT